MRLSRRACTPVLCLCLLLSAGWLATGPVSAAPDPSPRFRLQVAKSGLTFSGKERVTCQAEVTADAAERNCSFTLKLYRAVTSRAELSSSREGRTGRLLDTLTLAGDVDIPEGASSHSFDLNLASLQLADGVYPYTISLVGADGTLASEGSFLVVRSQPAAVPLNLVLLWSLHEAPAQSFAGEPLEGGLRGGGGGPAIFFMDDLMRTVLAHPEVGTTLAITPLTYSDLQNMRDGYVDSDGAAVDGSDPRCRSARYFLDSLARGASEGAFDLLPTTYAYADLEPLALNGWDEDIALQIGLGQQLVGELSGQTENAGLFPPLLGFYDGLIPAVQASGIRYTVLSQDSLAATKEGSAYLDGPTLAQPLNIGSSESGVTGFVVDERLFSFLADEAPSLPPHQVLQNIVAELGVLAEELPSQTRVCTLLFPDNFKPSAEVLEELYTALGDSPWLHALTLTQAYSAIPATAPPLELPSLGQTGSGYLARLSAARDLTLAYQRLLLAGNPLIDRLNLALLQAESADFLDMDTLDGDAYVASLENGVREEMARITLGIGGSITLSSQHGNIPVLVTNKTDYAVKATLRVHGSNVEFPEGDAMRVVINPKENRFEFPVVVSPGGSQVTISVEQDGLLLDTSTMKIKTSGMNTLAIWLLVAVVSLLVGVAVVKRARRRSGPSRMSRRV